MITPLTHVNSVKQSRTSTLLWVPSGGTESILSCLLVSFIAPLQIVTLSVIMNRDDISSSFSHGMAVSGMSEFFTITCNGATSKSMAVLVWNQLDMIDPRHGVSFQLHRYEYPSTLYTQQQPVPQLRLIRESLNQSRNNLSAILKEKFELNVASMQLPSDRQRIGPILVEAKVLYAAEKCQRSIGDRLTVNSGNSRDEYYIYCLIMIFMTMVSLIITTRCYIMEIMNENVQTAR